MGAGGRTADQAASERASGWPSIKRGDPKDKVPVHVLRTELGTELLSLAKLQSLVDSGKVTRAYHMTGNALGRGL